MNAVRRRYRDEEYEHTCDSESAFDAWGNWYIMRTSHEFGWATQFACLNYFGCLTSGHKVLFDTPEHVRVVDVATGQLAEVLRHALALKYWWHRDLSGYRITDAMRAQALGAESVSRYREVLRTAKWLGDRELSKLLDLRRRPVSIS